MGVVLVVAWVLVVSAPALVDVVSPGVAKGETRLEEFGGIPEEILTGNSPEEESRDDFAAEQGLTEPQVPTAPDPGDCGCH